jgi:U3 small nucleolar ribonucleoprotein protein LCP5
MLQNICRKQRLNTSIIYRNIAKMALDTSLPTLLATLTQALTSALESTPELSAIAPPKDGISLLDVKNELLLSYLQNLVFLILLKLRDYNSKESDDEDETQKLDNAVVRKLVEMRVYLEKGVRPLEARLKYQIDKVLRAADDAARATLPPSRGPIKKSTAISRDSDMSDESDKEDEDEDEGVALKASEIDDLQYRPNPTSLIRPANAAPETHSKKDRDGLYKPPRITATAMPTTERREKAERKPQKSATLDEFINTELSETPFAEPSIGSTIIAGGRRSRSDKERKEAAERKEYEEKNYMRLPKESKKERAKKGGRKDAGYGGEEWRGLGEGIDRIERLTTRKAGSARTVLEKSRKRAVEDGPRGSGGPEVGEGFQKRIKTLDGGRRDRGNTGRR